MKLNIKTLTTTTATTLSLLLKGTLQIHCLLLEEVS